MSKAKNVDWKVLKRIIGLARPHKVLFVLVAIVGIILAPIGVARPVLINKMVDDYILDQNISGLAFMASLLVGILLLEAVLRYWFIYNSNLLGQSVIKTLRVSVFRNLLSLKPAFFDKTPIGRATTRTISDIEAINQVFSQGVITIVADLLGLIAVLIVMFVTSWKLTLVCLITLPFMIYGSYIFKEKVKKAFQIVRDQISDMNAFIQEHISGMKVVQIFNTEKQEIKKFKAINREYTSANLRTVMYYALFFPFVEIISAISIGLMVWYGARGVINMTISPGVLVVFPIYINMLFRPIRMIADRFNTLQMGMVAGERVFDVLDIDSHIEDKGTIEASHIKGEVVFDDVGFSYKAGTPVLKGVNFTAEAGTSVAIVGSTGSGKTTIINLLNRFYEIDRGDIIIDKVSIRDYRLESLRKSTAMVLQDVFLFTGSLKDNISLKDPSITDEAIIEASRLIGADRFFKALPGAYDYVVTERGGNLSMGQRQLISFVRALVFNPCILILDEATASIDTETESVIQEAIDKLTANRTSFIIAHRLSTIRKADKIIVLDQGKVIEEGTHDQLIGRSNGRYKELYQKQITAEESVIGR
jgi:ATP-binding cassette subfamily B protein